MHGGGTGVDNLGPGLGTGHMRHQLEVQGQTRADPAWWILGVLPRN